MLDKTLAKKRTGKLGSEPAPNCLAIERSTANTTADYSRGTSTYLCFPSLHGLLTKVYLLLFITPKYYKQASRFLACMYTIIIIIIIFLRDRNTYSDICKNICISRHVSLDLHEIRLNFSCIINEPYYVSLSLSHQLPFHSSLSHTHTLILSPTLFVSLYLSLSLSRSPYMFFSFSSTEVFFLYLSIEYNHNS